MARPTRLPEWATQTTTLPQGAVPNKREPSPALRTVGFDYLDLPTADEENDWRNLVYLWIQHLDSVTTGSGTALGGAALLDVGNTISTVAPGSGSTVYAPITSPNFAGNPTAPTVADGTANQTIATTLFVQNALQNVGGGGGFGQAYVNTTVYQPNSYVTGSNGNIYRARVVNGPGAPVGTVDPTSGNTQVWVSGTGDRSDFLRINSDQNEKITLTGNDESTVGWRNSGDTLDFSMGRDDSGNFRIDRHNSSGAVTGTAFAISDSTGGVTLNGEQALTGRQSVPIQISSGATGTSSWRAVDPNNPGVAPTSNTPFPNACLYAWADSFDGLGNVGVVSRTSSTVTMRNRGTTAATCVGFGLGW